MELPRYAFKGSAGRSFAELSAALLREYADKIRIGIGPLSEDQVWWRPNESCNSAGNLVLHICGNLSLWILHKADRDRAGEFKSEKSHSRAELLAQLEKTIEACREMLKTADLSKPQSIQGYETDGQGAVYHAVEHAGYHTGQILYIVKQLAPGVEYYPQHKDE